MKGATSKILMTPCSSYPGRGNTQKDLAKHKCLNAKTIWSCHWGFELNLAFELCHSTLTGYLGFVICHCLALHPQISRLDLFILQKVFACSLQDDPPVFQHICPVSHLESIADVLLNQQDGDSLLAQLLYDVEDF